MRLGIIVVALSVAAAPLATAAPPTPTPAPRLAIKKPVAVKSLSKEQLQALGDNDPVEIDGKTITKAQARADMLKLKPQADAWVRQKTAGAESRFQTRSGEFGAAQKTKLDAENVKATAAVARLRQSLEQAPTPTPKPEQKGPCTPHIASLSNGSNPVYPGMSAFLAGGSCFGGQQGTLKIEGQFPGGALKVMISLWKDNLVIVSIPANVSGAPDQTAMVSVVTADGKTSNKLNVPFVALRELRLLKSSDTTPVCSMGADINDCDPEQGRTFDGVHSNTIDLTDDHGLDKVKVFLKNGWVLHSEEFEVGNWGIGGGATSQFASVKGKSTADIGYGFHVHPFGYIRFYSLVYIEGPVGVSHK
jgi:hypothetical protein